MGTLEILNVQGGEVKLQFDRKDAVDALRARRYITEMMRTGFVLLVEVERDGEKRYERAMGFDENQGEYIIADFEGANGNGNGIPQNGATQDAPPPKAKKRGRPQKNVPMEEANATAVGPSAGG